MKKLLLTCAAALMAVGSVFGQVVSWTASNTTYTAGDELSTNTDVVSIKLGTTTYSWLYDTGRKGITTYVQGTPTSDPAGSYITITPKKDINFSLSSYSSQSNCNLYMDEAKAIGTHLKDFRQRAYQTNDFGTLSAGNTYYIYGGGFRTAATAGNTSSLEYVFFCSFTAKTVESYTVSYVDDQDPANEIKAAANRPGLYGDVVTATAEDMARIEYNGENYDYVSGNKNITLGTESSITLVFQKLAAAGTSYTIKYELEDHTEIASPVNHDALVGDKVDAAPAEVPTYITFSGIKYKYKSGNDAITLSEDPASNVITLLYDEAQKYNYSVTTSIGGVIEEGSLYEDETKDIHWSKYLLSDGTWYEAESVVYTVTAANPNKEVQLTESSVSYFFEAESVLSRSYGNSNGAYSGGTTAGVYNGATLTANNIAPGIYAVTVNSSVRRTNEDVLNVQVSTNGADWTDAGQITLTNNVGGNYSLVDVQVPNNGTVRLVEGKSQNMCHYIDYLTLTKTADYTVPVTISAAGWATFVAPCALDFTESGVTAYSVTPDLANNKVTLTPQTQVPAGKAVVIEGAAGAHNIPAIASAADFATTLEVSASATAYDNVNTYYYLGVENSVVGFRPLAEGGSIAAGKCFFKVAKGGSAPFLHMEIEGMEDGMQTGISLTPSLYEGEGACYDLYGRKSNGKGFMIQNGKVVLVK